MDDRRLTLLTLRRAAASRQALRVVVTLALLVVVPISTADDDCSDHLDLGGDAASPSDPADLCAREPEVFPANSDKEQPEPPFGRLRTFRSWCFGVSHLRSEIGRAH
ncbi:MAG: hypothetical protein ACF8NJ_06495, partial [Phycisphaerales bacterium JB038]